jgi:Abnormal spindle-like microcephaly-assoc'd, ASPM-SPD-2-Hydin/Glycosyl hydrolases family 39
MRSSLASFEVSALVSASNGFNSAIPARGLEGGHPLRSRIGRHCLLGVILALCALPGVSAFAAVSASPTTVSWAYVPVGNTGGQKVVTLTNSNTTAITISSIALTNTADFKISSKTCGTSLLASSSCTVNVAFAPTTTGTRTATLNFNDTGAGSPQTVALSGLGTVGASVSPTSLAFGSINVGSSSAARSTTLKNVSAAAISNIQTVISGTNSADFTISSNTCGASLAVNATCSVSVVFKPSAAGTRSATLTFTDSASNSPQAVPLSGSGGGGGGGMTGTLAVYPSSASVAVGTQQVFQAQLSKTPGSPLPDTNSLSYSVDGVNGGDSTTGTVTNLGLYTAPTVPGIHQLTVQDNNLGTTATSWITIYSNVTVDFGSRAANANPVAPGLFGAQYLESLHNTADLGLVLDGGITSGRTYAQITSVFPTSASLSQPNWKPIDSTINKVTANGTLNVHLMLEMYQSPTWLQQGTCGVYSMPSDVNIWASIAQQIVHHMDTTFPGVVTDYEIWNEPNIALCVPSGDDPMTDYMKLYAAAAPLMKQQALTDHHTIRVGGPSSAGLVPTWITAMLNDPVISKNIDFMSYHSYVMGVPGETANWDTFNNGTQSVYQATQDIYGPANVYEYAGALVSSGKQPQGRNLPIYITEYNFDWLFAKNCCSNDYTYGPLWNALYVADLLDAPFAYAGSPNSMSRLIYYAATNPPYYCLVGSYDTNMDCSYPANSVPQKYPQYFAYQLLGSPAYLGLQNGAYMAASMSPVRSSNGLVVTAFFTPTLDAVVLINPSQYTYTNMPVNITNSGLTALSQGTLYQIVAGQSIQPSTVSLKSLGGTSYSTTVTIGPHSVQAISLK